MPYYGNYSLRSEESVPLALALFDQPESDLKATKAEQTAVASGEYWQVAVTTLQGKCVRSNSCVRAARRKVTISQDRTPHLPRHQVRYEHTSPLIHKSIITVPGIAPGRALIALPCEENAAHGKALLFSSLTKPRLGTPLDMYFIAQHVTADQQGWIHKRPNIWCLAHTKSHPHAHIRCSSYFSHLRDLTQLVFSELTEARAATHLRSSFSLPSPFVLF